MPRWKALYSTLNENAKATHTKLSLSTANGKVKALLCSIMVYDLVRHCENTEKTEIINTFVSASKILYDRMIMSIQKHCFHFVR